MGKLIRETGCKPQKLWNRRYDLLLDTKIHRKGVNATACYGSQRFKLFFFKTRIFLKNSWKLRGVKRYLSYGGFLLTAGAQSVGGPDGLFSLPCVSH
jgi:hypothetical protein